MEHLFILLFILIVAPTRREFLLTTLQIFVLYKLTVVALDNPSPISLNVFCVLLQRFVFRVRVKQSAAAREQAPVDDTILPLRQRRIGHAHALRGADRRGMATVCTNCFLQRIRLV